MEIFSHSFMLSAFLIAFLISISAPLIGNIIVLRRLSTVGDALAHAGLAGVAIGLIAGINPVFSAVVFSVISALLIEVLRKSFPKFAELSTSILMSLGIGLAAVLSGFVKDSKSFDSFLFGSIVIVSTPEIVGIALLVVCVVVFFFALYKELLYITFDESSAKLSGVPVFFVNMIFTVLTAVTVSIASRTVGALIISSVLVIPVACALLLSKSYKSNILLSVCFAALFMFLGLYVSYYLDTKPSGTIILIGIVFLVIIIMGKQLAGLIKKFKAKKGQANDYR